MTRADIEELLTDLDVTARYLESCGRVMRLVAERIATAAAHVEDIVTITDATVTAGRRRVHGADEDA